MMHSLYWLTPLLFVANAAQAQLREDATRATNDKFQDVAGNIADSSEYALAVIIMIVTIIGFVVVSGSLYTLYKASKDEREKPLSGFVGLFVGGAMAGTGTILLIMKNTVIGA